MSVWTLALRQSMNDPVDASVIRLKTFRDRKLSDIQSTKIIVAQQPLVLSDVFDIQMKPDASDRIVIEGDLNAMDRLGDGHDAGEFRVVGHAGNYAGSSMTGGTMIIEGNVGDFLSAPHGSSRKGISGGRIEVGGSAGHYAGHRMRRGELFIAGDVGRFAASQMIAGTMVIAGVVGEDAGTGMRRGTLIVSQSLNLPPHRFTPSVLVRSVFPALLYPSMARDCPAMSGTRLLVRQLANHGFVSRRGDRAVAGQGEILTPK